MIPAPPSLVVPFANTGDKNVVPVAAPVDPGAASYDLGFPPSTMIPLVSGGIPPSGLDMNGVLNMISAHTAWLAAGGFYVFNSDVVDIWGGYQTGAIVRSATDPLVFFYSTVDNNITNPDSGPSANWLKCRVGGGFSLIDQGVSLPAGLTADIALTNSRVGRLQLTTISGDATINTISGSELGQIITIAHGGPSLLTLTALSAGTGLPFFLPADISLLPFEAKSFRAFNNAWYPL